MDLSKLPFDNLYKFLAVFGLVLLIYGSFQATNTYETFFKEIESFGTKADVYNVEKTFSERNQNDSTLLDQQTMKLKLDSIELEGIQKQLLRRVKYVPKFFVAYFIMAIVGAIISALGFIAWYYNTQVPQDEILDNQAKKYKLEKSILVHSTQFKKEFSIYEQLWEKLIKLRNSTASLRPMLDTVDRSKTEDEIKNERLKEFDPAFNECVSIFDNNRPFYPEDVYKKVEKVIRLCRSEAIQYSHDVPDRQDGYWERAQKNIDDIIDSIDEVCESMRERMEVIQAKE